MSTYPDTSALTYPSTYTQLTDFQCIFKHLSIMCVLLFIVQHDLNNFVLVCFVKLYNNSSFVKETVHAKFKIC